MKLTPEGAIPSGYFIGQEIEWDAPWISVNLWVELPFWLMVGNTSANLEVGGHAFEVEVHEDYSELHVGVLSDSKQTVVYQGPRKKNENLSHDILTAMMARPGVPVIWRKCKTVLKIKSRCNEDVWKATQDTDERKKASASYRSALNGIRAYLSTLCLAHIPVVNRLVQGYRLATYDYFPYEVSPWDVPVWLTERDGRCARSWLAPYKQWDLKPRVFDAPFEELAKKVLAGENLDPPTLPYKLIEEGDLQGAMSLVAAPGEFEVLDALNLMERGDYSGAVRRITTAIEVIVEAVVRKVVEVAEGKRSAVKFLQATEINFRRRVEKYEQLSGGTLPDVLKRDLTTTRNLRHRIVHRGYRIVAGERGHAQRAVDTGRWIYNWFENDPDCKDVREKKIALRSLGRGVAAPIFPAKITPDGVVIEMFPH